MKSGHLALLALGAWGLLGSASVAEPYQEVMSNAFRCSAISDLRSWLDCYYGAAQPVRVKLGLPAAPQTQQRLVSDPPQGGGPIVEPELRNEILSKAFQCQTNTGRAWLDCYYAVAGPARARLGLIEPSAQTSSIDGLGTTPEQTASRGPHQIGRLVAKMTSYSFNKLHTFTVVLDNGQVWRQISGDTVQAVWRKPAASYTVVVSPGLFGSFNMQVKGLSPLFKVERVGIFRG